MRSGPDLQTHQRDEIKAVLPKREIIASSLKGSAEEGDKETTRRKSVGVASQVEGRVGVRPVFRTTPTPSQTMISPVVNHVVPTKDMPWKDSIALVLKKHGEPMQYLDITDAILDQKLRESVGATPSYTVSANFTEDKKKGAASRFVQTGKGMYGLREWGEPSLPEAAEAESLVALAPEAVKLAIHAYGMYWERESVDWSKSSPRILGQQFQNSDLVDHFDQRGLYVLYDHRTVVYVGRATQLSIGERLKEHTVNRLRSRWDRFSWFGFKGVREDGKLTHWGTEGAGLDEVISLMEAVLIEILEPPQNRQQGKGLSAVEYLQAEDPDLKQKRKMALVGELVGKLVQ